MYSDSNVLISGIHTHSGPAGYFQYVLFEVRQIACDIRIHWEATTQYYGVMGVLLELSD